VAVGAPHHNANGQFSGHVKVFEITEGAWSQIGSDIEGSNSFDKCGAEVSLSADGYWMAVGCYGHDSGTGYVKVYQFTREGWSKKGDSIFGGRKGSYFGSVVSLSADGQIMAVGAPGLDAVTGHVYVYTWLSDSWVQIGAGMEVEANGSSTVSVSLSADGSMLAAGAKWADGAGTSRGHVEIYKFDKNDGYWSNYGGLDGEFDYDNFGDSVSLSSDGNTLAVGAPDYSSYSGRVCVYKFDEDKSYRQLGDCMNGVAKWDFYGKYVSISDDGLRVAIGGVNIQVNVFGWEEGVWSQIGSDIKGDFSHVSLSAMGYLAMGSPGNDAGGPGAGSVRVVKFDSCNY